MSIWSDTMAQADPIIDELLGDAVEWKPAGAASWQSINAYIEFETAADTFDAVDEMQQRPRLKVAMSIIPTIARGDRFRCMSRLGVGLWQCAGSTPRIQGRYLVADLQKASQ